jgi:hypothetical protein
MSLKSDIQTAVLKTLETGNAIGNSGISIQGPKVFGIEGQQTALKSMLEPYEIALLYVLAKDYYSGSGYIVDAGCLFGISTFVLAAGIRQNAHCAKIDLPIQSFDLFEVNPPYDKFAAEFHTFGPTSNALGTFLKFNAANLDLVSPHQGDFLNWKWKADAPIEIIFNDLSKTVDLNNHMFQQFVSRLIPGKGFFFQQDYVHFAEWWIAASMEYYADDFEELGYFYGATKLFRLKADRKPDFASFNLRDLSFQTIERLLIKAMERAPLTVREALRTALGMFYIDHDRFNLALQTVSPMKLDHAGMDILINADLPTHENFANILPSNRRKVIEYAKGQVKNAGN